MTKPWSQMDVDEKCDALFARIADLTNQLNGFAKQVKDDRQKLEALARLEK